MPNPPVVSFHPLYEGDIFRWERNAWDEEVHAMIRQARAVILPTALQPELYFFCTENCPHVFPNYEARYRYPGKIGNTLLCWTYGFPHPQTAIYPRVESIVGTEHAAIGLQQPKLPAFPFVLKANHGGEGKFVWLINDEGEFKTKLRKVEQLEWKHQFGFLVQEYIAHLQRTLRVVVIGETCTSYWRTNTDSFHHNLHQGGSIDHDADPELQIAGRKFVGEICRKTGINLAGFDLIFRPDSNEPLLLEINYTFGRTGLGGSDAYTALVNSAIDRWLQGLPAS